MCGCVLTGREEVGTQESRGLHHCVSLGREVRQGYSSGRRVDYVPSLVELLRPQALGRATGLSDVAVSLAEGKVSPLEGGHQRRAEPAGV